MLAVLRTEFTPALSSQPVLICHLLRGALKRLGIGSEVVAAIARVEDKSTGAVQHLGACQRTPILRPHGHTDGYAVLWSKSLHRMIDPSVVLTQRLRPVSRDEDLTLSGPIILSVSGVDIISGSGRYAPVSVMRGRLSITWEPQPRWSQGLALTPRSELAAGLDFGNLALATATLELIKGVGALGLRSASIESRRSVIPLI
jgi:hypothetical protein